MTDKAADRPVTKVTLICTVFNEAETISAFIESVYGMSVIPSEFIVVDGGSDDGTTRVLEDFAARGNHGGTFRLIVAPDCNLRSSKGPIAKGRNIAVREAKSEIIACTDAGCLVDYRWLEEITKPLLTDQTLDVVGGWYIPDARSFLERCIGLLFVLPPYAVDAEHFMPSSRSFAFRKRAWAAVGGYPELSFTGEDTKLVLELRRKGFRIAFARDALVHWRMRPTLSSFLRMVRTYGLGDGSLSILPASGLKSAVKIAVPLTLLLLAVFFSAWFVVPLCLFWWLMPFRRRIGDAMSFSTLVKLPVLTFLQLAAEVAYLSGYIKGSFARVGPVTSQR